MREHSPDLEAPLMILKCLSISVVQRHGNAVVTLTAGPTPPETEAVCCMEQKEKWKNNWGGGNNEPLLCELGLYQLLLHTIQHPIADAIK